MQLSDRLQLILRHYELTQGKFAARINSYPSQVSQILKGTQPGYEVLLRILQAFPELNTDWLMLGAGDMLKSDSAQAAPAGAPTASGHGSPGIITATVDAGGNEMPVYVGLQAHAGYLSGHGDKEFLSRLPGVRTPFYQEADVRIFEVKGDSMVPTFYEKDIVFAQRVYDLNDIRNGRVYVVVSQSDGIVLKRLTRNRGDKHITCISDNPYFERYTLDDSEVTELWAFRRRFTAEAPAPGMAPHGSAELRTN